MMELNASIKVFAIIIGINGIMFAAVIFFYYTAKRMKSTIEKNKKKQSSK